MTNDPLAFCNPLTKPPTSLKRINDPDGVLNRLIPILNLCVLLLRGDKTDSNLLHPGMLS